MFICNVALIQDRIAIVATANKIETASPQEWIALSESVGVVPPWKGYAIENGMLPECRLKAAEPEKPLPTTERETLLTIIAALCDYSAINHQERGAAKQISKLTEEIGATVSDDTVRRWLKMIPGALEKRMK